ncbi:MAG: GGDEF domain-containing protein [Terracidiphilus sp.]
MLQTSKLPTLTTAQAAHRLTSEQAARAYPVHLRAVVTYFDPDSGSGYGGIFVHDSTGSIFLKPRVGLITQLAAGTVVDVRGVTAAGKFSPIIVEPKLQMVQHSHLPANPPRVSFSRLVTGAEDSQWVEVEGVVHSAVASGHDVILRLAMADGTINARMQREASANYSSLIDAKVRIHANVGSTFNRNYQIIDVHLSVPNMSAVQVLEPAPGDPFEQPAIPIDNLLRWNNVSASFRRVHLRGKVTLQWPDSSMCLQDATRGICAQMVQKTHFNVGDIVDVIGFVGIDRDTVVLRDAVSQSAHAVEQPVAESVSAEQALLGNHDSELIRIDGQLIGYNLASSDSTLLLASGKNIFTAILPKNMAGAEPDTWKIGSKLRITGICSVQLRSGGTGHSVAVAESFRVLMRSPADVTVLQQPPWWTPAHALVLLALALTATLGVLAWVVVLRRRIEQQAELLRESERQFRHMALHDNLTGLATRLLLQDRLNLALESSRRNNKGLAALMLDLDKFKEINDTYGHPAGDEVLRVTAIRVLRTVRKVDTVARVGGDEFVVLLPDLTDPKAAERIAGEIVKSLTVPIPFAGREVQASVSVGVCTMVAEEFDADALLRNADAALYQAKASGRNRFAAFQQESVLIETT